MNLLFGYNAVQAMINFCLLGACFFTTNVHPIARVVESFQICDVLLSASGMVRSNTATATMQIFAKLIVVVFGQSDYIHYLIGVWAFSDATRYAYHLLPNSRVMHTLRYSQYKVLYPIGVGLELVTILPVITNLYLKYGVIALYIAIFPQMFNHTSKMETKQHILRTLNTNVSSIDKDIQVLFDKKTYYFSNSKYVELRNRLSAARYNWKAHDTEPNNYILRDYGIQISWRLVYLIEYFGAFVAFPLMVSDWQRVDVILWTIHYGKRLFESAFIHSFSSDTMPFANVFKNSAYYWGAGFLLGYYADKPTETPPCWGQSPVVIGLWFTCQLGNAFCHYYLANLRSGKNTREHILPTNVLFRIVSCPNYTFEILGWALFACLGYNGMNAYFGVKALFCTIGAAQMYQWARGKKRRYKKLFGDKYKVSGVLLPGV
jgi:very-long-chain enoyl-CoA reductase